MWIPSMTSSLTKNTFSGFPRLSAVLFELTIADVEVAFWVSPLSFSCTLIFARAYSSVVPGGTNVILCCLANCKKRK